MQGANPFMQEKSEPPLNGSPNAQTPVSGGELDAGMAPVGGGGSSETTKPRQMPAGSPPMGMGADPMGGAQLPGAQPVSSVAPLGQTSAPNTPQQPPTNTTALLRQVRAEVKRDNPEVPMVEAHRIALAAVALIQAEGAQPINHTGPRASGGGLGDLNNPQNPNSPLHPRNRQHLQKMLGPAHIGDEHEGEQGDGQWQNQAGGYTKFDDRAYQSGYRGKYPYATGAGLLLVDKLRNRHSGQTPPGKDHPDSRQIPATS
jgi:hypothetical protein